MQTGQNNLGFSPVHKLSDGSREFDGGSAKPSSGPAKLEFSIFVTIWFTPGQGESRGETNAYLEPPK